MGTGGDGMVAAPPGSEKSAGLMQNHPAVPPLPRALVPALLFAGFLALYALTAAPSVLSGDSAEFQLAAALLGVAHPTTYPLYTMLGHLATRLIPFGEVAWRVTLTSSLCAALAVALFFPLTRRVAGLRGAALVGALALGLAPGLWNAATLAEVYALLALLIVALALALTPTTGERPPTTDDRQTTADERPPTNDRRQTTTGERPPANDEQPLATAHHRPGRLAALPGWRLCLAAFLAGLGFTHHGLFAITALPLLAAALMRQLVAQRRMNGGRPRRAGGGSVGQGLVADHQLTVVGARWPAILVCFLAGMAPWLYPPVQFALHGPFDGQDYGLPRFYYWGAPRSYAEVLDLMTGGTIRRGIFRLPEPGAALEVLRMVGRRLLFEFGPFGAALGLLGALALARQARWAWWGAAWVFFSTLAYLLLLGPAVGDAPVFTLPMLLPWALWIAAGAAAVVSSSHRLWRAATGRNSSAPALLTLAGLLLLTLAWGTTRHRVSAKSHLWLYREFAAATFAELPEGAAVIAPWEQGMTLQYLRLVEGKRPDLWVDVVEPGDDPWGARAARRYPERPVYFIGPAEAVAGLPVELVREDDYALLFRLRR
jgi:hypothetical protein